MGNVTTTIYINGEPVEPNSAETYAVTVEGLSLCEGTIEAMQVAVPDVLRDQLAKVRDQISNLRRDAEAVVHDLTRWDGDHDKAMAEREFRRGKKR